jgi:hypothetical protein
MKYRSFDAEHLRSDKGDIYFSGQALKLDPLALALLWTSSLGATIMMIAIFLHAVAH